MNTTEMCITAKSSPPYGGEWILNRSDVGIVGQGYIFEVLVKNCMEWRLANGLPVGIGFEYEVERTCCEQYPDECQPKDVSKRPRTLTYHDVLTGTATMFSFMAAGRPLENAATAEARASICAVCPNNVQFSTPCGGICGTLKKMVQSIVGSAGTSKDHQLKSCYICGCYIQSAVWLPLELQLKPLSDEQRSSLASVRGCWKRSTL
jgi:hypothetical protein